ncbi:MAG: NAD(P)-dependent oxidoreductase [Planctomycetota bacterium]|jgi:phosphoglycerate dehydrogenase-like enzyme
MSADVFFPRPPGGGFLETLRSHLDERVRLETERGAPGSILVEGRPSPEQVESAHAVVIPYAGVPPRTLELMRERFPHVALHNLHHNAAPTAELAMALLLATAKRLLPMDRALRAGDWSERYVEDRPFLCDGKTALVLGYGAIGRRVAHGCRALGMRVLATRRGGSIVGPDEVHGPEALHDLLPRADALFVCLPRTERTEGVLGERELALLRPGSLLVNIARGPIVEEAALYAALKAGRLAAGLDVWYRYPEGEEARRDTQPAELPFHELDNVVLSPHRGGLTADTEALRARHLAEMLNAAARNEPMPNRVDLQEGY